MADVPAQEDLGSVYGVQAGASKGDRGAWRPWRNWFRAFVALALVFSAALYVAVVLIDPFSTGRFSFTQRIDFTTSTMSLARAGLVRDRQFDGAIIGDSTAFVLDPVRIAADSGLRIAQLSLPAMIPTNLLTVARAYERHHRGIRTFEIFVLSMSWCQSNILPERKRGPFPDWLYESTDRVYLSRILFPDAVVAAAVRVGIWLGIANEPARADGYAPVVPRRDLELPFMVRPTDGPPRSLPFPEIDALAAHIAALPADDAAMIVFAPPYIAAVPMDGSAAAARLAACKERVSRIAATRPRTTYLDLMTDNPISRSLDNFADLVHFTHSGARLIEREVARQIKESGISRH